MHFDGTVEINAPRDRVWDFLMDPNKVGSCGPGVESIEVVERTGPDRAVLKIRGQAPGSAVDGVAEMNLSGPAEGPTSMAWAADVNIAGTLASVGARLIEGTAHKMIGQTFDCIRSKLEA
jgi:carbon monoxide dehydrogenase subunit G